MSRTAVNTIVSKIKRRFDYDIVDTDLEALIIDAINDSLHVMRQLFYDNELYQYISAQATFKTTYIQPYSDITNARIVGNSTTFTGVAGDTVTVTIDSVATAGIALAACVSIATVVAAINAAVGATRAYVTGDGFLEIKSNTSGATSNVTIADTAGTACSRLFASAAEQTNSGIVDLDEILMLSERTFKFALMVIPYQDFVSMYPDPDAIRAVVPDVASRWADRIYFGPTPSQANFIYMDYIKTLTEVAAGGTMPFENTFDPLVIAMAKCEMMEWLDSTNSTGITVAKARVKELVSALIMNASKNVRMNRQVSSRRNMIPYFSPRKKIVA